MSDNPNAQADVSLTQADAGLKKILVAANWDFPPRSDSDIIDVDLSCFVLGRDNLTREDEDFIFYNNPQGAALSIRHLGDSNDGLGEGDEESISIDLDSLSFEVWSIVFVVSIYGGNENDTYFGLMKDMTIKVSNADSGNVLFTGKITGTPALKDATALRVGELYRNGVQWFFSPTGEGIAGGLGEVARGYGLQISSTT